MKHLEKKLDGNYTRMLSTVLNKSWKQHSTKLAVRPYNFHLTNHPRGTIQVEYSWRNKDELINNVVLWTPTYGQTSVGRLQKHTIISSVRTLDVI